jgi:peptidoglycan LD-endopeptidase CwlK
MASRDKKDLHPELVEVFEKAIKIYDSKFPDAPKPFLTCTHRSNAEQDALYAISRTKPGKKVTNAKAGQSPHNQMPALAFDIAFITITKKLDWAGKNFKQFNDCVKEVSSNVVWGGDWNGNDIKDREDFDPPHYELKNWKKLKK